MSGRPRGRGSSRPPARQPRGAPPPRRGLLDALTGPRAVAATSMPGIGRSLVGGLRTVLTSPWIVGLAVALVLVLWLAAVAFGFKGPFSILVNVLSIPPVSTWSVDIVPTTLAGTSGLGALVSTVGAIVVRAALHAAFVGLVVDQVRGGAASHWSVVRGLRAFPTTLAIAVAGFMLLTIGSAVAPLLGGLSLVVLLGALVLGIYLFAFAPFVALTQGQRTLAALSTSIRAARMPGSGNLVVAVAYALPSIVLLLVPKPGSLLGVNPSIAAWIVVLAVSVGHLAFLAAFGVRYLAVADEVPPPPERPARGRAAR